MSTLTQHRGARLGNRQPGIADTAYYFTAAGGSGANVTFPAPSGRVPGAIMVAHLFVNTNIAGGTLWTPTQVGTSWSDSLGVWTNGSWFSTGLRGAELYRIADGTSNDDLVVQKAGGTATGVRVIIVAFRGYTGLESPNKLNSSPQFTNLAATPQQFNVQQNANSDANTPAGLWVGHLAADEGTHPLSLTYGLNPITGLASQRETINTGGTDPYLETWYKAIPAGTRFPATSFVNAVAASGNVRGWSVSCLVTP